VHLSEGRARQVDAVRFPSAEPSAVRRFTRDGGFGRDLAAATAVDLMEVKVALNRAVIGQLLVGRELLVERWEVPREIAVMLTAVVAATDRASSRSARATASQWRWPPATVRPTPTRTTTCDRPHPRRAQASSRAAARW
jgi:hypothetical protein